MTSSKVRRDAMVSTARRPEMPKRREIERGSARYTLPCLSVRNQFTGTSCPDLTRPSALLSEQLAVIDVNPGEGGSELTPRWGRERRCGSCRRHT
jgi:hypothetical protein